MWLCNALLADSENENVLVHIQSWVYPSWVYSVTSIHVICQEEFFSLGWKDYFFELPFHDK